ncbi:hypothetical protein LOZ39_005434 [Ophidiomyces ophidiicola]|nr:hypothetical protein LOZ50_005481 [Ophidiomyces ophidiicola]KAI2004344.1 hypothetical protein LOZ49_005895 [Ophidiomyces ophidiicola]KAI2015487.1 hypothetical protein LOZ46_005247 [Ophidiomyces ophidiicola]KAI2069330.1 hypothetical protein LOZ39_005434 [Ophidiomyces ophidiicola]KAI2131328.1 hypothetical protein LOZ29_005474 [Ophidiomyces ophidiicola]
MSSFPKAFETVGPNRGSTGCGIPGTAPSPRFAEELRTAPQTARSAHPPHRRSGPRWHQNYSHIDQHGGRVLVIDFVKQDASKSNIRKVAAQEIFDLQGLRTLYNNPERNGEAVLRVFHVQNADWAARYLLRKFNIDNRDDLVGTDFGQYVRRRRPDQRRGKPVLSGKTWKVQYDPWRGISKTSFSLDYLKDYQVPDPTSVREDDGYKMMELNNFGENDNPAYGYDVFLQRISCYIQHKQVIVEPPPTDPDITSPYLPDAQIDCDGDGVKEYIPRLRSLDNGNAILIFDDSHSGVLDDTLIPPRDSWEARWRRLPFFLAFESRDLVATDEELAFHCTRVIMEDLFKALAGGWDILLDLAYDHVSILEDKVYEQPADETRAPELWTNSKLWLKMEKLMFLQVDIIKELKIRLRELTDDMERDDPWLGSTSGDFDRIANLITEDLVKPTKNLISLVYRSVSIRDSRQNIRLSISSMNVDTFSDDPSIKWYFIASVPFMLGVLVTWYLWKYALTSKQNTLYRRGIYEDFFNDLANKNPALWSRDGPRNYIVPKGRMAKIKWYFIKQWSAPERTIRAEGASASQDDLGVVSKIKRRLIQRWTSQIACDEGVDKTELALGSDDAHLYDTESDTMPVAAGGLANATELATLPAAPAADSAFEGNKQVAVPAAEDTNSKAYRRFNRLSLRSHSKESSANGNSGVLVEEEDWQWLSQQGRQGKEWALGSAGLRGRSVQRQGAGDEENEVRDVPSRSASSRGDMLEGESRQTRGSSAKKASDSPPNA